jgi:predicted CopG family antitoxin
MLSYNRNNADHKTIVVSKKNYELLKKLGHVGDSFDDVIGALLSKIVSFERNKELNINV